MLGFIVTVILLPQHDSGTLQNLQESGRFDVCLVSHLWRLVCVPYHTHVYDTKMWAKRTDSATAELLRHMLLTLR